MKRSLLYVLILTMVLSIFSGCNKKTDVSENEEATAKVTQETTESTQEIDGTDDVLSYLNLDSTMPIVKDGNDVRLDLVSVTTVTVDPEDHWIWAFFKEYCNVDIDATYYDGASWSEQQNLLFASDDLPDIFYRCSFDASEIIQYGQVEGMFYPMQDLISDYAPLIQSAIDKYPSILVESTTPDGNMYTIPGITDPDNYPYYAARYFIHSSWLDTLELSMPETLDDLHTVLTAFKNDDPNGNGEADEVAWVANTGTLILTALGINAWHTNSRYIKNDGTISMAVMEKDKYKYYLQYMKQMLDEGIIPSNYYTMEASEINATFSENVVGLATIGAPFEFLDNEKITEYNVMGPLISDYNNEKIWPNSSQIVPGTFAIAYDTEYPEACIRVANVFFIEESPVLFWMGPCYTDNVEAPYLVDGYTEGVYYDDSLSAIFPYGGEAWGYLPYYVTTYYGTKIGFSWSYATFSEMYDVEVQLDWREQLIYDDMEKNVIEYEALQYPNVYLSPDDLERSNELITPITDYISTMEAKYIMGSESIDNIDEFYAELEALGVDEYLEIQQAAYDGYMANAEK